MAAPHKRPLKLATLHGEHRPSRVNLDEPVPAAREPIMPSWFTPAAAEIWERVTDELRHMDLLHAADTDALMVYCQAVEKYIDAAKQIDATGPLLRGRDGGVVKNPMMQFIRDLGAEIRSMACQFGLTPSARTGLVAKKPEDPGKSAERLLSG